MNALSGLSFLPVVPWPVLFVLAAIGLALVWWPAGPRERSESTVARGRRTAIVVLLLVAALRPAIPGNDVRVDASAVDVYLVVDTTSSVMARDYGDARPRLEGVRTDIKALVDAARPVPASPLMTFDIDTTRAAAVDERRRRRVRGGRHPPSGDVGVVARLEHHDRVHDQLRTALERGRDTHPERARLVFYLGDGEQTAAQDPPPVRRSTASSSTAVRSSATARRPAAGWRSPRRSRPATSSTRRPASPRSRSSTRSSCAAIASQLGVPYLHRTIDDGGLGIVESIRSRSSPRCGPPSPPRSSADGRSSAGSPCCSWPSSRPGSSGPWSRPHPGARRPARSVASTAGGQISPRAGMRLAALRPNRIRGRWAGP